MSRFLFDGMTIDAARRALTAHLADHDIAGAEIEARMLLGHMTGLDLTAMTVRGHQTLDDAARTKLQQFAERRVAGEPVARIVGAQEFWGLSFALSPATLIPRSDTETLVEAARDVIRDRTARLRIADLGTGTGAILIALLTELPNATGIGTDLSKDALETAAQNATRHGIADRTTFIVSDYASKLDGQFDLIVSNPPYIRTNAIEKLAVEVREHDPHLALDGGVDGLDAYRKIASQAAVVLTGDGVLALEIGMGQEADVTHIIKTAGLVETGPAKPDLAGIPRVILARKPRP